eukprot:5647552-Amphidinium_carterae.1
MAANQTWSDQSWTWDSLASQSRWLFVDFAIVGTFNLAGRLLFGNKWAIVQWFGRIALGIALFVVVSLIIGVCWKLLHPIVACLTIAAQILGVLVTGLLRTGGASTRVMRRVQWLRQHGVQMKGPLTGEESDTETLRAFKPEGQHLFVMSEAGASTVEIVGKAFGINRHGLVLPCRVTEVGSAAVSAQCQRIHLCRAAKCMLADVGVQHVGAYGLLRDARVTPQLLEGETDRRGLQYVYNTVFHVWAR